MAGSPSDKKHPLDWAVFLFLVLTFCATTGAAIFTGLQYYTGRDQEIRQTRAYVFLKDITLKRRNEDSFDVIPEWENAGNSETNNMHAYTSRYIGSYALPSGFSYGDINRSKDTVLAPFNLGPRETTDVDFAALPSQCLKQFNNRDRLTHFIIWGWTTYNDTLTDKVHTTRFCWIADQVVFSRDGNSARISHYLCNEGNCADAECRPPSESQLVQLPEERCDPVPAAAPSTGSASPK